MVSIRFGQIFQPPMISVPRSGILNLHSGILPDYRGVLATFWAMLEDADQIGCTLHRINDNGIDTGPIVGIRGTAPDRARSLLWNIASLYDGGTEMIRVALEQVARGQPLTAQAQIAAHARYYSYPMQAQVAQFRAAGYRLYSRGDYSALFARYGLSKAEIADILADLPAPH
jgi:methionyl-tRNA formyltransferase